MLKKGDLMRRFLFPALVLLLSSCAGPAPATASSESSPTPIVIVQTVLVTSEVPAAAVPSATVSVPATLPPVAQSATPGATSAVGAPGPITIPASFYGPVFTNVTVSTDTFSLRCAPKEITFDLTSGDIYITQVDMYIRVRDKHSLDVPNWNWSRTLETDGLAHFWVTLKGEDVPPDSRKDQAWFDFQFIGISKNGGVIGRTEKIKDQVSYTIDC